MSVREISPSKRPRVKQVPLGDIVDIIGGKPAPQGRECYSEDGIPFVRMKDLGRYHRTENLQDVTDHIRPEFAEAKRWKPIRAGAILMPRSGSVALNHRAILGRDAIIVSHICALEVKSRDVCNRYLYRYLCSLRLDNITKKTTGLDAVNFSDLRKLVIPLPPLDEQRRIAAILDKADAIRRKREQALALADDLLKSTFLEMFGDPVTNPKGFEAVPFGEVVEGIEAGWSAKGEARPARPDEMGVLKISAVTTGTYLPSENKAVQTLLPGKKVIVPKTGDLLFSRANTRELVAAVALVRNAPPNVFLPDKLWRISLDRSRMVAGFAFALLSHPGMRTSICRLATGTSGSMLNVSKAKLVKHPVPVPPVKDQQRFEEFSERVAGMVEQQTFSRDASEVLFASLSQRAFRGEL